MTAGDPRSPEQKLLRVSNIALDPENPRLPQRMRERHTEQSSLVEWMIEREGVIELVRAIGDKGYFDGEPLLVTVAEQGDCQYTVVEGNRRLAALKLLRDDPPIDRDRLRQSAVTAIADAQHRPPSIPAIVYYDRSALLSYLGYRHVTGIKAWEPLAKARYLRELAPRANTLRSANPSAPAHWLVP